MSEWTTRRAPHMEGYMDIVPVACEDWPDAHRVRFTVGNQRFRIGDAFETKAEAEWYRDMFCIALDRVTQEKRT